mmetsp:Transcript_13063/g.29831  ORF Transcript_13063/g.29831 Transcript_13063/m.29831 type:complete len:247 (-) Transcript_13063:257-997(-)|eukprot:CAMPEP_0181204696 /NCGR_PEP_ID=MMETSP1096-20121128/20075_1 /TAXON_ID=156174 ORGANISM="Chrysochromulina ericina, Strain CCMP281" /NCGR_SAMPLE_ID=MMETSP1096 /ASSEMBLY_ACC=CAM_ASM_000453 /LENGTH=246 /DNA_ID=CAMNT_0023295417 /DNA_START=501 /DNA_END=1241 /DNA_ORIENTATION=+
MRIRIGCTRAVLVQAANGVKACRWGRPHGKKVVVVAVVAVRDTEAPLPEHNIMKCLVAILAGDERLWVLQLLPRFLVHTDIRPDHKHARIELALRASARPRAASGQLLTPRLPMDHARRCNLPRPSVCPDVWQLPQPVERSEDQRVRIQVDNPVKAYHAPQGEFDHHEPQPGARWCKRLVICEPCQTPCAGMCASWRKPLPAMPALHLQRLLCLEFDWGVLPKVRPPCRDSRSICGGGCDDNNWAN